MYPATTVTSKTTSLPVTLTEAKEHLAILSGDRDEEVDAALRAATEYCEAVCGRSLRVGITQTQAYCDWPLGVVRFDRQPVKSISSVYYYDSDGNDTLVASTEYRLIGSTDGAATLEWDDGFTMPTVDVRADAVRITYVAGYAALSDVPAAAKYAVRLKLHEIFGGEVDDRQRMATERSIKSLLGSVEWGWVR